MQKQAFYKQVHVWPGKALTTLHIGQNSGSLLGRADTQTTIQHIQKKVLTPSSFHRIIVGPLDFVSLHFKTTS